MPKKKKKSKIMKPVPNQDKLQFEVKEKIKSVIKPKDIFEGIQTPPKKKTKKKVPKGSHRMPDGSIMKDKDHKGKNKY